MKFNLPAEANRRKGEMMNINELIKMCRDSISNFSSTEGDKELYYMGRVHAFINVIFMLTPKCDFNKRDLYNQITHEWEEAFSEKYGIEGKEK